MKKLNILLLSFALIGGCSTTDPQSASKAQLVGVKITTMIPNTGPVERVYFTSVDDRDNKKFWGSYPEKLDVWPGNHIVVVACEWRPTATAPPTAKGQRRIEGTFEAGHIYKFNSTLDGSGKCSISYEDITSEKSS